MNDTQTDRAVLITGASTGIGEAAALRLAGLGLHVFAGVRDPADGERLTAAASGRLTPVVLDVTDPATIASARQTVETAIGDAALVGLVNNAGIFCGGPLEFVPLDDIRRAFDVNVFGAIAVTQAFLPPLRTGGGRIVNVSSIAGLIAMPFNGPYAGSKFALEALSDAWRMELRPWGIHVALVEPGLIKSKMADKGLETLRQLREKMPPEAHALYGGVFGMSEGRDLEGASADLTSDAIEHALLSARPKRRYLVGRDAKIASVFRRLPLGLREWVIARHMPQWGEDGAG